VRPYEHALTSAIVARRVSSAATGSGAWPPCSDGLRVCQRQTGRAHLARRGPQVPARQPKRGNCGLQI